MEKIIDDFLTCKLCDSKFLTTRDRNTHIKNQHHITLDEYIITVYFNGISPKCNCGCGTNVLVKFNKNKLYWSEYTKNHFPRKKHSEETKEKIKNNTKKAIQSKYGVDNVFLLKTIQNKIKETNLQKYGVENPMQFNDIVQKSRHNQSESTIDKIKKTNLQKYGSTSYTASDIGKANIKKSNLEKYGVDNTAKLKSVIDKVKQTNLDKYGVSSLLGTTKFRKLYNGKTSKVEREICDKLGGEHKFIFNNKEFDIKVGNTIIEIDGDFWHPSKLNNLTFIQISSAINDFQKYELVQSSDYNLIKIKVSNLPDIVNIHTLKENSYVSDFSIKYDTVIMDKNYLKNYIDKKGKSKLESYIPLLLKFIRTFHSEFPYPSSAENIETVIHSISEYDFDKISDSDIFNNNSSLIGVSYLKSIFKSYWKSNYKNHITPVDAWKNDDIMKRVIKYRIGINDSDEIFDFSLHQLIRGLSAYRYTISFFKPVLAAAIYKKLLGNNQTPTVFDPCAGFGGRLLGFKSVYPNGTYVGVEPNKETFEELKELVRIGKFTNVELYNCKIEDFNIPIKYDIGFTSIPYYDLESYSNNTEYLDFENWSNTFMKKILSYKNLYINLNQSLYDKLKLNNEIYGYLKSNTSHFNNTTNTKSELIIRI